MKITFTLFVLLCCIQAFSQVPAQGISYQAVARADDGSVLSNEDLDVRIGIISGSANGDLEWEETHSLSTSDLGLFTLVIGEGTSTDNGMAASFEEIAWGNALHFVSVEIDPGDGIFELMGISQMLTVPYAFYAESAGNVDDADSDPENELITDLSIENDSLIISESGTDHIIDMGDLMQETVGDECITLAQLQGTDLNIIECGEAHVISLESLVNDSDWLEEDDKLYNDQHMVGVGTNNPQSRLDIKGSVAYQVSSVQGPANLNMDAESNVVISDITNGTVTINLPSAASCLGRTYTFKVFASAGTGTFELITSGSETVDGSDDPSLTNIDSVRFTLISDGSNWWIISGTFQNEL